MALATICTDMDCIATYTQAQESCHISCLTRVGVCHLDKFNVSFPSFCFMVGRCYLIERCVYLLTSVFTAPLIRDDS
jgi:hypothetical protein